ncbi:MAG: hypothetical protein QXP04_03180, partial [Candidatus Nanoarchaeia archaeon]|nr:hypothetical protein [Candidatus Jingweiarchaeum tengchongense]
MSQGAGNVPVWQDKSVLGDNLGNHIATKTLDMSGYAIVRASGVYLGSANNLAITTNTTVFGGAGAGIYVSTHVQIAGALQIGSTATILGNEFSVGGSTFIISAGRVGIATNTPTGLFQVGGGSLTILANGNVGIGVTNPGARLDIQQSDTTQSYSLRVGTITTAYHLVVTTTGRVGIGTLTPTSKLNIESIGPTGIDINSNTDNAYINIKYATGKISFIDFYDGNQKKLNLALDSYNFSSSKFVISSLSSVDIAIAAGNGSGGKVGIGTFSPQAKLDIYGDGETILLPRKTTYGDPSGINGMIYYNQNIGKFRCYQNNSWIDCIGGASSSITQGDSSVNIIDSGVGYINFIQDGNEVMRISNSKLAIGTITPIDNQNVKLHVSGSIHLNQNSLVGDFNTISGIIPFNTNSQIERFSIFLKGYEVMSISTSGLVGISTTNPSSALHIVSTGIVNSALRVDLPSNIAGLYVSTTGLIGVGTLNPKTKLHIENNEENFIALVSPQNSLNGIAFYSDSINNLVGGIYRSINNDLRIWIANSDIFTVTNTGNVGIGNTSPSEKLHVNGNLRFSGALMPNGQAGNSGQVLVSQGAGNAPIWQDKSVLGDNLGNHIATRTLSMGNYPIINVSSISINGSGINLGSTAFEVIGDTFTVRSGGRVGIGGIDSTSRLSILNANYILGWGGGYQISSLLASDQGGAIELGGLNDRANPITNGTPYIDFHFGTGSGEDYNYRIINNANNRLSFISKTATTLVLSTTNVGIGASSPSP